MRRLALAGATALLALAAPSALGASPVTLLPKAGCDVVTDAAGDASLAVERNAHNWDITGLSYRMSSAVFSVAIRVPGLQDGAARGTGDSWTASFVTRGKTVAITGTRQLVTTPRLGDYYFTATGQAGLDYRTLVTINGNDAPLSAGISYNKAAGFVVMSVDRAALEKATGGALDLLSGLAASSSTMVGPLAQELDAAAGATGQSVKASENACFV